jgi:hypothetical protein
MAKATSGFLRRGHRQKLRKPSWISRSTSAMLAPKTGLLSVSGTAELVHDKGKMQALWSLPENSPLLLQLFQFSL